MQRREQLTIGSDQPPVSCAFTGHRILERDFSQRKLRTETEKLVKEGVKIFYNGMAMGFDLVAAETVLRLKKKYPDIRLIACVPCYAQEKHFSEKDKRRYTRILKAADEKVYLSESYYNGCMQKRDRYMADRADVFIAYCKKETGGTAYTVNYFRKKYPYKEIVFL